MRVLARAWFITLVMIVASNTGAADEDFEKEAKPVVSVEVKPDHIRLAARAVLTVRVKSAGRSFRLPPSMDLAPFVELSRRRESQRVNGQDIEVFEIELTTYEKTGELEIPGFELVAAAQDGGSGEETLEVPTVGIVVDSVLKGIEQPQPRDIVSPVSIVVSDYRLLVYAGLILAWLLVALALRLRRAPAQVAVRYEELPPSRPAHQIALEKLKRIVEDDLLRKGRRQEFFVRISDTIREYLGNRYGFFALDLTSRELLEELRDRPTRGLDFNQLGRLLTEADLVKFARFPAPDDMSSRAIDGAFSIVEATRKFESEEAA